MKNLYIPSLKNKGIDDFTTDNQFVVGAPAGKTFDKLKTELFETLGSLKAPKQTGMFVYVVEIEAKKDAVEQTVEEDEPEIKLNPPVSDDDLMRDLLVDIKEPEKSIQEPELDEFDTENDDFFEG